MLPLQSVEILKKLDKKELKRFGDFLSSPYFNNSPLILKIFDSVKKEYPNFTGKLLQSETMFKKLYPSEEFKETRIQNLYSEFGKLLREFLGYELINENKNELDTYIAEALSHKSLYSQSNKLVYKKFSELKDGLFEPDSPFHMLYRFNYSLIHNLDYTRQQHTDEYLEANNRTTEFLITFFMRDFYSLCLAYHINREIFGDKWKDESITDIADMIDTKKLFAFLEDTKNPYTSYIKVFYYLYDFTKNKAAPEDYILLKTEMLKIIDKVPKNDALFFIARAIQIILSKIIPVDRTYYKEIFELSNLFCSLNIFPNHVLKNFGAGPFRDMFTVAVILKEYDWAENFAKEYSQFLSDDIRENELNFCMGNISFKRGKYHESLSYFNKLDLIDIIEKINVRFYYMMNYIELKAYENALSSLNTIRQFYADRRNEIPEMFAVLIPDAVKYFNEIIKCEEEGSKLDEAIYQEAKSGKRFYHIKYVLDKMQKLM